ncbi:hypothetical protein SK128_019601 [Halocaridina rubra]|uniref:Uncharacterized protein n=1 Tax=Halocaridina rubra TaxID=373956 RepID=A0AAN8ZRQ8_HALRR
MYTSALTHVRKQPRVSSSRFTVKMHIRIHLFFLVYVLDSDRGNNNFKSFTRKGGCGRSLKL